MLKKLVVLMGDDKERWFGKVGKKKRKDITHGNIQIKKKSCGGLARDAGHTDKLAVTL